MFRTVFGWIENIVRKGENAGYQHFLLFPQCFQKASLSSRLKPGIFFFFFHKGSSGIGCDTARKIWLQSSGECTAISDCTYVQSDLALHYPQNKSIVPKHRIRVRLNHSIAKYLQRFLCPRVDTSGVGTYSFLPVCLFVCPSVRTSACCPQKLSHRPYLLIGYS